MKHLFKKFRLGVNIFWYLHVRLFSGCWSAKRSNPVEHIWYCKPAGWLGSGSLNVWNNFPGAFFLGRIWSESSESPDLSWWVNSNSPLQRFRLNYRSSCSQKAPRPPPAHPTLCLSHANVTLSRHFLITYQHWKGQIKRQRRRKGLLKECTNTLGGISLRKWNNKCQVFCLHSSSSSLRGRHNGKSSGICDLCSLILFVLLLLRILFVCFFTL